MRKRFGVLITVSILFSLFIAGTLGGSLILVNPVYSQDKYPFYDKYDVSIVINKDGSLSINETMVVVYYGGSFTYAYRAIPFYGFDDVVDVKVYELLENNSLIQYTRGSYTPHTYMVKKDLDGVLIKWWYSKVIAFSSTVTKTFILSYRVTSAVDVDSLKGINYLDWYCLPNEHLFIASSHINITIPFKFSSNELAINPQPDKIQYLSDSVILSYILSNLDESETLEVYVGFPKVINPPFSLRKVFNRYVVHGLVILIAVTAALLILYRRKVTSIYRDVKNMYVSSTSPPEDLDSSETHILRTLRKSALLPLVTLFQLAEKKLITFVQLNEKDLAVKLNENAVDNTKPWERDLLSNIKDGEVIKIKDLYNRLSKRATLGKIYLDIIKSLTKKGLIPDWPSNMGLSQAAKTLILLPIAIIITIYGYVQLIAGLFAIGVISITLVVMGAVLVKTLSVHRTREGEIKLVKAKAYANFLESQLNMLPNYDDSEKIIETLDKVISHNFSWIIAIKGINAFRKLKKLSKLLLKKWRKDQTIAYWYPVWLSTSHTTPSGFKESGLITLNDLAITLSNISTIFMRSGTAFAGGGIGGFGGGGGGGGGAAGVG